MKRFSIRGLLFVLPLFCSAPAWATIEVDGETYNGDFRVEYSRESATGETDTYYLYYNITSEEGADVKTVEVTYPYQGTSNQADYYTGDIIIPEEVEYENEVYSVTAIGDQAFEYCTGLTSIEIPSSITSIDDNAFALCTGLTSIEISSGVTSINYGAFNDCTSLTSIEIPSSVTSIGQYAFEYCTGLTSIDIPNSVTTIGAWAFGYCYGLEEVTIGEGLHSALSYVFGGVTNISVVNYNAISVSAADGGGPIFCNCTIKTFNIGANVTKMRSITTANCTVSDLYSFNPEPPTLEDNAFQGSTIGVVFVPEDAGVAYANTDVWKDFGNMYEDTVTITPNAQDGEYYYCTRFSPYSYTLQAGEEGAIITDGNISESDDGGTLNLSWDYVGGEEGKDVVPANTALLIRSKESKPYANPTIVETTADDTNDTTTDLLCGNVTGGVAYYATYDTETKETTPQDVTTYVSYDDSADTSDYYFYKFTFGADGTANENVLGFYWATREQTGSEEDGAPFTVNGKHAWLAIPKSMFADGATMAGLPLNKMATTGIKVVDTTEKTTDAIYNLQGMRVSDMSRKGLYIVGGKKVIKK